MKKLLTLLFALIAMASMVSAQDAEPNYLCFEVKAGTSVSLKKVGENPNPNIQYSFDKKTWYKFSGLTVENDCSIYFKGKNPLGFNMSYDNYSSFEVSDEFKCSGNIMTLIDGIGETTEIPRPSLYSFPGCGCFARLFEGCTGLTTAPELPATTLASYCYYRMFYGCTSLTTAPELPATTLADNCYKDMFSGCTSLTIAPELPATTLVYCCYNRMFQGCTSLTTAPELPATTLVDYCYTEMFQGCTSLTTAPELPATTLADYCYSSMFYGCTSLTTTAPELPATTLASFCYYRMFYGCTSLTTAPELPATTLANKCYKDMFSGCTSLTIAPELPATTLGYECYSSMFYCCRQLKSIAVAFNSWPENGFIGWVHIVGSKGIFICPSDLPIQFGGDYIPNGWQVESKKFYTITSDVFSLVNRSTASVNDNINVTYTKRDGYLLTYAAYNGTALSISDYKSSFTMPAADVEIKTVYTPIVYAVSCTDANITADKKTVTIEEKVNITIKDRTSEGYKLDKVFVNSTEIVVQNYKASFDMKDYLKDVTIKVTYSKREYSVTTDSYSMTDKTSANLGDKVNVTFTKRLGYTLASATYNGTALSISDYKSSFTMPSANVEIKTVYTPIDYAVSCADANITADKTTATIDDKVNITIKDRTSEGYKLDKVLVNSTEIAVQDFKASFDMKDYLKDVTIKAVYSTSGYSITTDSYSTTDKTSANVGDKVNVTFTKRNGFTLASATYNGNALSISDYKSSFTMPAANVEIKTVYTPTGNSEINYLCFEVKAGTKVSFNNYGNANPNIQYSFDKKTWSDFSELTVENDCSIYFKGVNPNGFSTSRNDYSSFDVSDEFKCSGNVMSLIDGVGEMTAIPTHSFYCFARLFAGCPLTTAPELPATTLTNSCYEYMFSGCTSLTVAPELPATTLTYGCYCCMFYGCTRLTTAPELPATTLDEHCYENMFSNCTSLTTAPELPATTLAGSCYYGMFRDCTKLTVIPKKLLATTLAHDCYNLMFSGCTSLTTAPEIMATTLAARCCTWMFKGCTSLTTAPELPATRLAENCYQSMFSGCTSLTTAPELPATTLAQFCYWDMFSGCTSLTTAPKLPATRLAAGCYKLMFMDCKNLTTAPELPATKLAEQCYHMMFSGCKSLITAPELPATTLALHCYYEMFTGCTKIQSMTVGFNTWTENSFWSWVSGVSDKGIFICPSDLPQQFGENYIPEGWIVNPQSKNFAISSSNLFVTIDKTSAKYNDKVNFSVVDRTTDGYKFDKVLVNNKEVEVSNYAGSFDMMDYLSDVTIFAQYSKIPYTITTDEYSQVANSTATVDDAITVTFKQREGFDLSSATYNGNSLNIKDYKATFTMPAQDVAIKAVYTEKVYEIEKPSEGVSVSQPSAKAGDEITISVNPKDGYTVHLYVNGAEVALSGNSAVYTMPSGKIEITVKYVVEEKTPVSEIELDNCAVSAFPNPAKSGEKITLKVGGKVDTNNTKIYIYNASGSLVMQIDDVQEYNQLTLRSGVYVGVLVTKGGKKTFRVAVK